MSYDISINISASGADSVERELKKIEAAYKNLQNMGMNFSQASGLSSMTQSINSLVTSINNFSTKITSATAQVNALAAAIKGAATNAQALGSALSVSGGGVGSGIASTGGGGGGGKSAVQKQLDLYAIAQKKTDSAAMQVITSAISASQLSHKLMQEAKAQGVDRLNPEALKLYEKRRAEAQAKQERSLGTYTSGLDPRFSSAGLNAAAFNSVLDELHSKNLKHRANTASMRKEAEQFYASNLSGSDLAHFQQMLAIEGNRPKSIWNRIKDNVAASPFGMASVFMLRYRVMTTLLDAITKGGLALSGHSRMDMVDPNFELASIGFTAPMRASMEANAVGLSSKIPGLTIPQYFQAAAQVGSAMDVSKYGPQAIAQGTKASLVFGSLSNLPPEKSGELMSNTYFALKDTKEFQGMDAGKAFEKIAGSMFSAISVSGAWGPDIQKAFAHFLPMGVKSGLSLDEMLAYVSTLKTQGFTSGGRGGKWLLGEKGYDFMARAMLFGGGDVGQDFYDVRTQEAMDDLKRRGIKPGTAKQLNEDAVRYLKPIMAARIAEDPFGTLAMISEKVKSAMSKGFDFKDMKASQDFLAQLTKTFIGGGVSDMQDTLRRMQAEGGWEGANKKYDEANAEEPGAAWKKFFGSLNNFSDALSNTTGIFKAVGVAAEIITGWAERLTRETELTKGGNINPRTNRPYPKDQKELAYAEGSMNMAYREANRIHADPIWNMDNMYGALGINTEGEWYKGFKEKVSKGVLGFEKEYYANNWQKSILPKPLAFYYIMGKNLLKDTYNKIPSRPLDRALSWLFGEPNKQPGIKPLLGDTSGLAKKYSSSVDEADALDKLNQSPYANMLEYRDRPDLLFSPSDVDMFKQAKQANALATLKNAQFMGTAPYVWSRTWRTLLNRSSIEEIFAKGNFTPENPPPIIDYRWGEGMSAVSGEPRMAQFMGDNMEFPSPQKAGQQLDLGPVNSSLSELVSALQNAASKINSVDIKGPSADAPGKPVSHKWGNSISA